MTDNTTAADLRELVCNRFDFETWQILESILSAHLTLMLEEKQCVGLVVVGTTSSGKTTPIRMLEGFDERIYRSDDVTPASFVSHDATRAEEELEEIDLLPKLRHQTLVCRDMANWFSGDRDRLEKRMGILANVMDGDGYTRDSGSQGSRGYEGDYRFTFIGASTPLKKRAWDVMGHTGSRLVFVEKTTNEDMTQVLQDVFEGSYDSDISTCQEEVRSLLSTRWSQYGYGEIQWTEGPSDPTTEAVLEYLIRLVRYSRATLDNGNSPDREGGHRIAHTLWMLVRGRALLFGRRECNTGDLAMCARIALCTMQRERREIIRMLINPNTPSVYTTKEVMKSTGVSRPTARKRMDLIERLGIGECEDRGDNQNSKTIELNPKFEWPAEIDYPDLG